MPTVAMASSGGAMPGLTNDRKDALINELAMIAIFWAAVPKSLDDVTIDCSWSWMDRC